MSNKQALGKYRFPDPLPILHYMRSEPPPLDFLWRGGPLAGSLGAVVSPGGVGKSFWALAASMAVASGGHADPLRLRPVAGGRVLYLSLEDPKQIIHQRLHSIVEDDHRLAGLTGSTHEQLIEQLEILDMLGSGFDLADPRWVEVLIQRGEGVRLIVIDTMRRAHSRDENSNGEMAQVLGTLERVCALTGTSVLYLHHVSKVMMGQADQQTAARGASVLVDNARWAGYVRKMDGLEAARWSREPKGAPIGEDAWKFVEWGVSKSNYAAIEEPRWLERGRGGALHHVELFKLPEKKKGADHHGGILGS